MCEWVSVSCLQALLEACRSLAPVSWHTEHITSLQHLLELAQREAAREEGGVAAVVVAAGAASALLPGPLLSLRLVAHAHMSARMCLACRICIWGVCTCGGRAPCAMHAA